MQLCAALLVVFGPGVVVHADTPKDGTPFVDQVDVNVINVEVFVTDAQGEQVHGLTADDFEIYEDGEPVEIANFFATRAASRPASQQVTTAAEAPAPAVATEGASKDVSDDQRLNLLVYVDNYNIRPASRNLVLNQMQQFLEDRLGNGDHIMLVSFSRSVRVITPFTRDREALFAGVDEVRGLSGRGQLAEMERAGLLNDIVTLADFGIDGYEPAISQVRSYIRSLQEDLEQSSQGLRNATRTLAGLPGRKAVLYVSDGLSQLPGQELYDYTIRVFNEVASEGERIFERPTESFDFYRPELFESIVAEANAHQVTFYTLNAAGAQRSTLLSAEYGTFGPGGTGMGEFDEIRNANLNAPMIDLAERTGGRAIRGTGNFDGALDGISRDLDNYYSLGFTPRKPGDGEYHRIRVEAKVEGLQVRHRLGYVNKPRADRVAEWTLSSLIVGEESNPFDVKVDLGPAVAGKRDRYIQPVIVRVPANKLALIPQNDNAGEKATHGRVSIFLAVRDSGGGLSGLHREALPLWFGEPHERLMESGEVIYRTNLEINSGDSTLAVGVWDELSGLESVVHRDVAVPGPEQIAAAP